MARTAKHGAKVWVENHMDEIRVGLIAAAVAFFFTHGLPLWDDDYTLWLKQANDGILQLISRLILPFTNEPQTWGFSDRPVQVLIYKILHLFFGYWGTGFFFVKSLVFGALCGTMYFWMKHVRVSRMAAMMAMAVFVFSTNIVASLVWHSDFGVYSQLVLALILFWALPQVEKGPASMNVYKKGWNGLPKDFKRFLITFFVAVYLGAKLKGDVRLAPMVLLAYLYIFRVEKFRVYAYPFGLTFLATLPWSKDLFKHLPPFIPGAAGYQGWTYGSFSLSRVFEFLAGDALNFRAAHLSVFGAAGLIVVAMIAGFGIFRMYQDKMKAPNEKWGFFLVWLGMALLACGILAPVKQTFQLRYTLIPLVPATILFGMILEAALSDFAKLKWVGYATAGLIAVQCVWNISHSVEYRHVEGGTMVAVSKMYEGIEKNFPNAQVLYMPNFRNPGYKADAVASLQNRKAFKEEDSSKYDPKSTFVMSWESTLDARFSLASGIDTSACASSIFDAIFPCRKDVFEGAVLMKYVGLAPEIAQADQLDKQGNLAGARQVMEGYLQKDPGNHGASFILGLYLYRLSDVNRMEQVYDQMGPYFPGHPSVVYNWGLAKHALNKDAEASKLFQRALAMAPNDYAIGFNLAEAYFKSGKKARALATMDQLMKVYPDNEYMKKVYNNWKQQ